jgi:hypothetical protein
MRDVGERRWRNTVLGKMNVSQPRLTQEFAERTGNRAMRMKR